MYEIEKQLKELRLSGMAQCIVSLNETRRLGELSLSDGLQLMLQAERDLRRQNRNSRLIKGARFRYSASVQELVFDAHRGMEKQQIMNLSTCNYINRGVPIIVTGATGTGKSFVASALGHQACLLGFKTRYFGMQKLLEQINFARIECTLHKFFDKMEQTDLIIIDDFGMKKLDAQQMIDFAQLIEDRHARKATIIVSQLPVSDWYDVLTENTTAADAILDRVVHTAYRIELKGESRRKLK